MRDFWKHLHNSVHAMELTTGTEEAETLYGSSSQQDALAERTLLPIYHPFLNYQNNSWALHAVSMTTITCLTENATVINRCVRGDWFCGHGIVCWFDAITPAVFLIFLFPTALAKGMIVQLTLFTCAVIHTHTHMWYGICLSPMVLLVILPVYFFLYVPDVPKCWAFGWRTRFKANCRQNTYLKWTTLEMI